MRQSSRSRCRISTKIGLDTKERKENYTHEEEFRSHIKRCVKSPQAAILSGAFDFCPGENLQKSLDTVIYICSIPVDTQLKPMTEELKKRIQPRESKIMSRYLSAFFLILLWTSAVIADENVTGRISGVWIPRNIGPIADGLIYVFNANYGPPPQKNRFFVRVPDAIQKTNEEGKFSIELAEGTYYLAVQKKVGSDVPGPPQDGDLSGVIRNEKGKPIKYTVEGGKTTDIGILRFATVYKSPTIKISKGMTAITGVIKAIDGSPMANAVVLVYDNPEIRTKPNFISHKTGKDGRYIVQVDQEGTYFVTVRAANTGGRPKTGDIFGVYGGETAQPVTVEKQRVTKGIDIQVGQFVDKRDNRPEPE